MSLWRRRAPLSTGGRQARERAEQALEETRSETPRYAKLSAELREIRRENHLAQAFYKAAGRDAK